MCLSVYRKHPDVLVAGHNILVWKALNRKTDYYSGEVYYASPYRNFRYKMCQKYTAKLNYISEGYESFDGINAYDKLRIGTVHAGLHAFTSQRIARDSFLLNELYPAVVPAGSKFYFSSFDRELAATSLIVFPDMPTLLDHFGQTTVGKAVKIPVASKK